MRYLQTFNSRLRQIREAGRLSSKDVAEICGVEEAKVVSWEASDARQRTYPDVSALLDFCIKTETPLEDMLDLTEPGGGGQLELPGLAFSNSDDLSTALKELEQEIDRIQLSDEEGELLRRFRKTTAENRRMILQILGA
ncbi:MULTISPECIES: helix-turn-helix domain-containing protein [Marinobacter]|uniref:Helix-turn-helix transcriptional regulator n=1 Tax=Marinobacter xiaoshiensis TaxID=3073652 RepID=A0ABU2HFS7_9GAMM|nr:MULTISPECIES: helix-turn-helix transcriptional regulator [unclassified Marinobacter]MBK1871776.1 helix-turn-helix domain-containing protein [Marinobacter sp. 1-3A]MBK1885908.1 helix-turn-helix domain-containing protein [Marinobacter sp. DY40_1A1]MDS1309899.1 helix-turn-helix transcriptional regulator [Marinobacter sp. F60267]